MLRAFPLLLLPMLAYAIGALLTGDSASLKAFLDRAPIDVEIASRAFSITFGGVFIGVTLVLLVVEVGKSTRTSGGAVVENALALISFAAALTLLFAYDAFRTLEFAILALALLLDTLLGFGAMVLSARRHRKTLKTAPLPDSGEPSEPAS